MRETELGFEFLVGHPPADHQRECAQALAKGESVIVRAPTGSGKSEGVWIPFLRCRGEALPMRMIHVLPMRALVNQLESRMQGYVRRLARNGDREIRVAAMHGQRPESVLFYADAIFATLDQVVTSYACTPLSLSVRHGNVPAGAIPGSFLVFDEVHTFEPELGLQGVLVLAERAVLMQMPFVIMSATLPTKFIRRLADRFQAEVVEAEELQIPNRKGRSVTAHVNREELTCEVILDQAWRSVKTVVVVNTVERALKLYEEVRRRFECPVLLAHSRFYDDDRMAKERQIETLFGKRAVVGRCLLIATQVVEVGLDISCDTLLTELAPIDALVQRAGRCARWGGVGDVHVFTCLQTKRPYDEDFVIATEDALARGRVDGQRLTWELEKALVDEVCDFRFEKWARPEAAGKVLASLAEAAFEGNPAKAEKTVRDVVTVEVALHDRPETLGPSALRLPRCGLHPGVFERFVRESGARAWRVFVDRKGAEDYGLRIEFEVVRSGSKLMPGAFYVVDPKYANYDREHGLRLGIAGTAAAVLSEVKGRCRPEGEGGVEFWRDHVACVVRSFKELVLPREERAFEALGRLTGKSEAELMALVKLVLVLHDVGKLSCEWQRKIKLGLEQELPPGSFLAHRGRNGVPRLPPHATVSAWVVSPCMCRIAGGQWEEELAVPSLTAIAHHHSVRAGSTPEFEMAEGWFDLVVQCVRKLTGVDVMEEDFNVKPHGGKSWCGVAPKFLSPVPYAAYILLSRWLRLADRMATGGGEDAVLRYEKWFGNI